MITAWKNKIKTFRYWKKEFLKLEDLKYFNVYLCGSFNDLLNNKLLCY